MMNAHLVTLSESSIPLVTQRGTQLVDSRLIAENLGLQHKHVFEQIKNFKSDFEEFGILRFKTEEIKGRGQPEKFALLDEDQSYLLLTFSRNTTLVRSLKVKLVKAFREARLVHDVSQTEYLPTYHALHDEIRLLAAGSSNEKFVHMNFNKLINRTVGIQSGARNCLSLAKRSMLVVAQAVAANATHGATDHHEGYARAKAAVLPLGMAMLSAPESVDG